MTANNTHVDACPTCNGEITSFESIGGRPDQNADFGRVTVQPCGHKFAKMVPVEETHWRIGFEEEIE
jgi:hypothetical protein